jgi:hypothetical protein
MLGFICFGGILTLVSLMHLILKYRPTIVFGLSPTLDGIIRYSYHRRLLSPEGNPQRAIAEDFSDIKTRLGLFHTRTAKGNQSGYLHFANISNLIVFRDYRPTGFQQ